MSLAQGLINKMYMSYDELPKLSLPHNQEVFISDSTLRDGSQMPGIVISVDDRVKIFEYLHRIGIEKLEVFLFSKSDKEAALRMLDHGFEFPEVTGWARSNTGDIDLVLGMDGIDETGILMSVSNAHILTKMGLPSKEAARKKYLDALDYALDHGLRTRAHLEDVTRADLEGFVYPLAREILDRDPDCTLRLCDTIGFGLPFCDLGQPFGVPQMITRLREMGARNIETHTHDDFSLATANSLIGYWYGANWSNLTFLGIGERAGNAELEKVLLFLSQRMAGMDKYDLSCLVEFADYIEEHIGVYVPKNKAVVGKNIFAHESGIHAAGVLKDPFTYEPFPPTLVGCERKLMIGPSSGSEIVRAKVEEALRDLMKIETRISKDDWRVRAIHDEIRQLYDDGQRKSCISDREIRAYAEKYFMFNPLLSKVTRRRDEEIHHDHPEGSGGQG
ncbi:MAG TPA: isopropylmalate synthase [Methanotrichaceae archaeon]|nr:isopropylmalate synthase [Methanotrichaceae archaeon]